MHLFPYLFALYSECNSILVPMGDCLSHLYQCINMATKPSRFNQFLTRLALVSVLAFPMSHPIQKPAENNNAKKQSIELCLQQRPPKCQRCVFKTEPLAHPHRNHRPWVPAGQFGTTRYFCASITQDANKKQQKDKKENGRRGEIEEKEEREGEKG